MSSCNLGLRQPTTLVHSQVLEPAQPPITPTGDMHVLDFVRSLHCFHIFAAFCPRYRGVMIDRSAFLGLFF